MVCEAGSTCGRLKDQGLRLELCLWVRRPPSDGLGCDWCNKNINTYVSIYVYIYVCIHTYSNTHKVQYISICTEKLSHFFASRSFWCAVGRLRVSPKACLAGSTPTPGPEPVFEFHRQKNHQNVSHGNKNSSSENDDENNDNHNSNNHWLHALGLLRYNSGRSV